MVLKIAAFGCSFTFGDEFPDALRNNIVQPSKHTWANHLYKDATIFNYGISGAGCGQIMTKILSTDLTDINLVVVMWSFLERITLYKDNFPVNFSPSNINFYDQDFKICKLISQKFKDKSKLKNLQNAYETLVFEQKILYNEYFKNILLTQQYLKLMNKKFYFTSTVDYFSEYEIIRKNINSINSDTDIFYSNIDKNKFFLPENLGFKQWANNYNYEKFKHGHYKETAHIDFASLFNEWIKDNNSDN
jgi:hypothetical protein